MPRYRRYRLAKLQIEAMGERRASWTFTREPVSGTEFTYAVVDANTANHHFWEFLVRVPQSELWVLRLELLLPALRPGS